MRYAINQGIISEPNVFRRAVAILVAVMLIIAGSNTLVLAKSKTSNSASTIGRVTFDTDIDAGINYGTGIPDGEWVVAESQGVQLGVRATDRTDGLLDVKGEKGNRVGIYEASTGFDGITTNRAEWNYEWSVDLSGAIGHAAGKTLVDYSLALEQDYTEQSLFGVLGSDPVELSMPGTCHYSTDTVCQQSWNPTFGNNDFDAEEEGTYNLRFVLTPSTFNGPPVAVAIQVNVTN